MKKYYKVVERDGDRLVSSVMFSSAFRRVYSTTEWTHGVEGTPVMAFETRADARRFAGPHEEVWLAKVRRPRKLTRLAYCDSRKATLLAFWASIQGKRWSALRDVGHQDAPEHTVACEAIRLVRKVS